MEFDKFAPNYNETIEGTPFLGKGHDYFSKYKVDITSGLLLNRPRTILDFGCGIGNSLRYFLTEFPNAQVSGFDVSLESIAGARARFPEVKFYDPIDLESCDEKFDLIFAACVFHHIPPGEQKSEIDRISALLSEGGRLIVFEHNPYNPLTQYIVYRCPLDEDAILIPQWKMKCLMSTTSLSVIQSSYCYFFPDSLKLLRPFERRIGFLPIGGQYWVMAEKIS